jgi:hypothetical protein
MSPTSVIRYAGELVDVPSTTFGGGRFGSGGRCLTRGDGAILCLSQRETQGESQ